MTTLLCTQRQAPDSAPAPRTFDDFYRLHHPRLLRYARRCFGCDADDIAAETMVRALERYEAFNAGVDPLPWLVQVARNIGIDHLRRRARCLVTDDDGLTDIPEDGELAPEAQMLHRELLVMLNRALRALSEADCRLMRMRFVEGMSHEQIAEVVGSNAAAVRKQFTRARDRFVTAASSIGVERP
jgi:RNA polymerase sigma-70 factor (ECF subfamily)